MEEALRVGIVVQLPPRADGHADEEKGVQIDRSVEQWGLE